MHIRIVHPTTNDFICEYHIGESPTDDYLVVTKHGKTEKVFIGKMIMEHKYKNADNEGK